MLWICQNNLGSTEDVQEIQWACEDNGYDFMGVKVIPFSDELPDVPNDVPVVFYGATNWIQAIHRAKRWKPGTFLNEKATCSVWIQKYGAKCVNWVHLNTKDPLYLTDPVLMMRVRPFSRDDCVFVRPDKDNKAFAGQVMTFGELEDWKSRMTGDIEEIGREPIIVAPPTRIRAEWRLFIVNKKVVAATQYKRDGRLDPVQGCPQDVVDMVEEYVNFYVPAPIFVMDACRLYEFDDPMIVEIGCFNSAGFYAADIDAIVYAVSKYCMSKYKKQKR